MSLAVMASLGKLVRTCTATDHAHSFQHIEFTVEIVQAQAHGYRSILTSELDSAAADNNNNNHAR